ncbi:MAG: hypothetical protein NTV86_09910, partial [Planctomycetota bacterium]|nr:hypothetical protein [Planctomycetota bacterium]
MSGTARFTAGSSWSLGNPVAPGAARANDLTWYYLLSDTPAGNMCAGELVILSPATTVTVDSLATSDNRPALSGTVSDPAAAVTVSVNGHTYTSAVNHGDGTWTLADDAIAGALADGTYDVTATASVGGQVVATDETTNELVIAGGAVSVSLVKTRDASEVSGTTSGKGFFTVTRAGGDLTQDLEVYYAIDGASTATNGDDFAELTGTVTIAAGQTAATIDVLVVADGLAEPAETLSLTLSGDEGYDLGAASATMTIADNSPTVSIAKTRNASEANGTTTGKGVFTVTRAGGDFTQDLVVYYSIADSSTAASGADFAELTGVVVIAAGHATATIDVLAVND